MTDNGTKYAWVIHESKVVQLHAHSSCLFVPRVPSSVKNPHSNNNNRLYIEKMGKKLIHMFIMYGQTLKSTTVIIISVCYFKRRCPQVSNT